MVVWWAAKGSPEHHCAATDFLNLTDRWIRSESKDGVHDGESVGGRTMVLELWKLSYVADSRDPS